MTKADPRHIRHPKFYTKEGWLTPYALACGYIERKEHGSVQITLDMPSPGAGLYHVRAYDFAKHERRFWETFTRLTDARRHYRHGEALAVANKASPIERCN
ncbi:MAG: hypothetical protein KJZ83_00165 [Burkholderiaceae bacterium]|nr:hypothetical protein [Burkholderiaceae bacterium]